MILALNNPFPRLRTASYIVCCVLLCISASLHAGYMDDIGFTRLVLEQGSNTPDGSSIHVTQAEASTSEINNPPFYLPDWNSAQFSGKTITDMSGLASGTYSSHATSVGTTFYGSTSSIAPGIMLIDAFWANHWLASGFLSPGGDARPLISSSRIANHSWIGDYETLNNSSLLRRLDWVVETDEFIQCVGIRNSASANQPLLSSAYNVIAVGKSDGLNGIGTVNLDSVYVSGRTRPELVAPKSSSSGATPVVAASAALLMEHGQSNPGLSTDPVEISTSNRSGDTIYNTGRSEVIKAVLMAGADRSTANTSVADITDYRVDPVNQTTNGLDSRFGAGQINIYNSFQIVNAGEQNSAEDIGAGDIGAEGFDYDPSFGGSGGSNSTASYYFSTGADPVMLSATLAWNMKIDGGSGAIFSGTAQLYDLNLKLYDITGGNVLQESSASTIDSTETIWTMLPANGSYLLEVSRGDGQASFDWDYALAWHIVDVIIDTDGDGIPDSEDLDDDNDGLPDIWEVSNHLDPLDDSDASIDADSDGLNSMQEYQSGSDPGNSDTDNDGLTDGAEVNTYATDPSDADTDNDGLTDGAEVNIYGTDPTNPDADTDNDGVPDSLDNCPLVANPNQEDTDGNGVGEACADGSGLREGKEVLNIEGCGKDINYAMYGFRLKTDTQWKMETPSEKYSGKYEEVIPGEKLSLSLGENSKSRLYEYIGKTGKLLCGVKKKVISPRIKRYIVKLTDGGDILKVVLIVKYKATDGINRIKGEYKIVIFAESLASG